MGLQGSTCCSRDTAQQSRFQAMSPRLFGCHSSEHIVSLQPELRAAESICTLDAWKVRVGWESCRHRSPLQGSRHFYLNFSTTCPFFSYSVNVGIFPFLHFVFLAEELAPYQYSYTSLQEKHVHGFYQFMRWKPIRTVYSSLGGT